MIYRIIFLFLLFFHTTTNALFRDLARTLKVVHIKSISQKITNNDEILFEGEVEISIDQKLHVWADRVLINKKKQLLVAEGLNGSSVTIEDELFLILADRFTFDAEKKIGSAQNLRLHVDEGYFSARYAEKINDTDWRLDDMTYTACDRASSHWHIRARQAIIHNNCFVKASDLVFKVGDIPMLWLPRLAFPIQGHSKSGLMIPRFAIDYNYGIGVKQEYYKYISPHCDTTLGVDWRDRKGIVFSDEFRWARAPENYTLTNVQYAVLRDRFVQKRDKIVKGTDHWYWVNGKDFRVFPYKIANSELSTLLRMDFGTDKRIGYHFFSNTDDVDDTFNNSLIARLYWPHDLVSCSIDGVRTSRKSFTEVTTQERDFITELVGPDNKGQSLFIVKELEDRVNVVYVPHLEWNTTFRNWDNLFHYRHDFFFDAVTYRQEEVERVFAGSTLVQQREPVPFNKADVIRFFYRGYFTEALTWADNTLTFKVEPTVQAVSHLAQQKHASSNVLERPILGHGAYRAFFSCGAEWALPEGIVHTSDYAYAHSLQPFLTWDFIPKFAQDHWYYFDKWDRTYAKNQLAVTLRNSWDYENTSVELDLCQAYDFYDRSDLFFLRRGIGQRHLLPFRYDVRCNHNNFHIGMSQEYEWGDFRLLQSEINVGLSVNRVQCNLGYFFQKQKLQQERGLLSNIPHFVTANFSMPLGKRMTLGYDGQFYAQQRSSIFLFDGITPLIHRVRLEYDGHCWGCYLGWEEKKFKEYGMGRDERSITFSFRINSLGSFAKKFRKVPQIINRNQ